MQGDLTHNWLFAATVNGESVYVNSDGSQVRSARYAELFVGTQEEAETECGNRSTKAGIACYEKDQGLIVDANQSSLF